MVDERLENPDLAAYLDKLRELPFVREVALTPEPHQVGPNRPDAFVTIRTPRKTYRLALEVKRTFLDRTLTNGLIARTIELDQKHQLPLLLVARYVPRETGETLADAGLNFIDRPGNMNLKLGDEYHVLRLGRRPVALAPHQKRPGPALVKLLFTLIAEPTATAWPVRRLAEAVGIGKTAAATLRTRLLHLGYIARRDKTFRVTDRERILQDFVTGYRDVLRNHLLLGQYRAPEMDPREFLRKFAEVCNRLELHWAATGGPAAHVLERYYRGVQVPIFVNKLNTQLQRELKLVPNRRGPITLLRPFGTLYAWREMEDVIVAHPALIYGELLQQDETRANEAAEEIRERYLTK